MTNKNKIILTLSLMAVFTTNSRASDELAVQAIKAQITPQQIDGLIQKFQPSMKAGQRSQIANMIQQQLDQLSPQELSELANTKIKDMPGLVKQHISRMPPDEVVRIKQTLKQIKNPQQ